MNYYRLIYTDLQWETTPHAHISSIPAPWKDQHIPHVSLFRVAGHIIGSKWPYRALGVDPMFHIYIFRALVSHRVKHSRYARWHFMAEIKSRWVVNMGESRWVVNILNAASWYIKRTILKKTETQTNWIFSASFAFFSSSVQILAPCHWCYLSTIRRIYIIYNLHDPCWLTLEWR